MEYSFPKLGSEGGVTGRQGTRTESRELAAGCGRRLRSGSGLGWDGDGTKGQGVAGDATFRDSDRDATRVGTSPDEDGDVKAWHGEDEGREAGNRR
jgi:hypothetical protein